jgi:gas vesicle protein
LDANEGQGALVGAAAGAISGLVSAFAEGANTTAEETRRILLNCLSQTSKDGTLWQVVE